MCGISGIVSFERSEFNLLKLTTDMNRSIRHRGPDDEGYVIFENKKHSTAGSNETASNAWETSFPYKPQYQLDELTYANPKVVLGHRRLSIIDLSPAGHQPMCDEQGRYWLVFNGAIYNFSELKLELVSLGHKFYSHTDTEVLLYAYIAWGKNCVNKFIGMWAFVIYDKEEQKIFASRDRLGVKPFYYTFNNRYFAFASEIKALRKLPFIPSQLNEEAIYDYLALGKTEQEEESIFRHIFELPPSTNLELDLTSKKLGKSVYYTPGYSSEWKPYEEKESVRLVEELDQLLRDSTRLHLRTDAKVGACLSGGLDSSVITALISKESKKIPVFTVTSKGDQEDESFWAKKVVDQFQLEWHTVNPQPSDLLEKFEKLLYNQDLPIASANSFTHYELMGLVNKQGVKVTIDGQGADELFAGYEKFYTSFMLNAFNKGSLGTIINGFTNPSNDFAKKGAVLFSPFRSLAEKVVSPRLASQIYKSKHSEYSFINKDFWDHYSERISLLHNKVGINLNEILFNDYHGNTLKTMLRVGDRNSMHFGIETRVPFCDDYRIEEFAFKVPASYKVKDNYSKFLLRQTAQKYLTNEICYRKDKKGFSIPEKRWLLEIDTNILPYFDLSLSPYINIDLVKKEWSRALKGAANTSRLWRLLCFAVWMKSVKNA